MLSQVASRRLFHSSVYQQAAAATRKSFNKSSNYDKSKNRKGSGNDKSWKDSILKNNYQRKAQDKALIEELPAFNLTEAKLKFTKYSPLVNQRLHIAGAFNPHQYNELYSQPLTMVRPREDQKISQFVAKSLQSPSSENRLVLTGEKGVGKSTLLTHFQAQVLATENAILLPVSYADSLVDGSNDFKLNPKTNLYDQPMYSKQFIKKILNLNKDVLAKINLSKEYTLLNKNYKASQVSLNSSNTLLDLLSAKASDVNTTEIVRILFSELEAQSLSPVYFTVDNFTAFLQHSMTKYRDTNNKNIYFQNFTLADIIIAFLSGERKFSTGAVMVSTHGNHKWKSNQTLSVAMGDAKAEDLAYLKFSKFDRKLAQRLVQNGPLPKLEVSKFDLEETKSVVKHLQDFNLIFNEYNADVELSNLGHEYLDKLAQRKFIVSGNGNGKLLLDSCILAYA